MDKYKQIDLNDYVQTGEGGTSLTYTHKTRNAMAKLFNPGNEADLAEQEFLTARIVFEMGIPTPEPYQLVTDGQRSDFILHVSPETLTAHWNIFLAAYLGTDDKAVIGEYTKRLMSFYAVKLPYMYDLLVQGRLPEEAFKPLSQMIDPA